MAPVRLAMFEEKFLKTKNAKTALSINVILIIDLKAMLGLPKICINISAK